MQASLKMPHRDRHGCLGVTVAAKIRFDGRVRRAPSRGRAPRVARACAAERALAHATALSEQRQVICVGRSKRRPKRRLGREGAPLGQRGGAPLFVNLAGDEMALLIEMVVDLGMN